MVAAAADGPRGRDRLHRQRVARDGAAGDKKRDLEADRLGDTVATQRGLRGGDGAGAGRLPGSVRCRVSGGVRGRDAAAADQRDAQAGRQADAERITLVMDELNTRRLGALYEAFPPAQAKTL